MEQSWIFKVTVVSAITAVVATSIITVVLSKKIYSSQEMLFAKQTQMIEKKLQTNTAPVVNTTIEEIKPVVKKEPVIGEIFRDDVKGIVFVSGQGCEKYLNVKSLLGENGLVSYSISLPLAKQWTSEYQRYYSVSLEEYNKKSEEFRRAEQQATLDDSPVGLAPFRVFSILNDRTLLIKYDPQDGPSEQDLPNRCGIDIKNI